MSTHFGAFRHTITARKTVSREQRPDKMEPKCRTAEQYQEQRKGAKAGVRAEQLSNWKGYIHCHTVATIGGLVYEQPNGANAPVPAEQHSD